MGTCPQELRERSAPAETELSEAALHTYGRLLAIAGPSLVTYPTYGGGMICEDRRRPSRPVLWRILPDGELLGDSRYSYTLRAFTPVALPQSVWPGR